MTHNLNRRTTLEPLFTSRTDRDLVRRVIEAKRRIAAQDAGSFTVDQGAGK